MSSPIRRTIARPYGQMHEAVSIAKNISFVEYSASFNPSLSFKAFIKTVRFLYSRLFRHKFL